MKISPWNSAAVAGACSFGMAWSGETMGAKPTIYLIALIYTVCYVAMAAVMDRMKSRREAKRRTLRQKVTAFTAPRSGNGIKATIAVLLLCLLAIPSDAACRVVVKKAAVVEKVIVEKVAAIAVPVVAVATVPYYASYYTPPAVAPAANAAGIADNGELTAAIKALVEKLGSIEARIANLERGGGVPPMPPADPPQKPKPADPFNPGGAAPLRQQQFAASCVQCHKPGGAGTGANGITLFDAGGKLLPNADTGRMLSAVYKQRMPKGKPLSDQEFAAFVDGIDSLSHK